jgi:hypothetical protein
MPKQIGLATLLILSPLLALVVALASWVVMLRSQVADLERRVTGVELAQSLVAMAGDYSGVGVHIDVDRAMQIQATPFQY